MTDLTLRLCVRLVRVAGRLRLALEGLLPIVIISSCLGRLRTRWRVVCKRILGVPRGRTCLMNSRILVLEGRLRVVWVCLCELGANILRLIFGRMMLIW